jgi:AcrR family transcriptional regulator
MGLRERKKEQTRRNIEDAAFRLFEERGYAATTVAEIAEAADIAPRTFFAYFPSKEAVLFGDFDATFGTLHDHMNDRGAEETTFDALRAWIGELIDAEDVDHDRDRLRRCLIADNEALAAHERHIMGRFEQLIADNVARDLGDAPDDLQPRLVAAAAVAALMAMSHKDDPDHQHKGIDEEGLAQLDDAFAFLRGGIAALQERRAGRAPAA